MTREFSVADLMRAMESARDELKARVAVLVDRASAGLVADHKAQMPRGTRPHPKDMDQRHLADRVTRFTPSDFLHIVYSNAPHLHFVELGTRGRANISRNGKALKTPAYRGSMPKLGPIFVPLVEARRAEMLKAAELVVGQDREL